MSGDQSRHARWHRALVILLWTVSVVLVLSAVISGITALTESHVAHGDSRASGLLGAGLFLIVGILFGALARHNSARAPHMGDPSPANRASPSDSSTATQATPSSSRRGRRNRPVRAKKPMTRRNIGVQACIFGAITAGALVGTVITYTDEQRSSYTQHHGVISRALVISVKNSRHCGRGGCYYTFAAPVKLLIPVHGAHTSTIHGSGRWGALAGQTATIKVDPHDPHYSELPGFKLDDAGDWVFFAAISAVFGLIAAYMLRVSLRLPARPA